MGREKSEGRYEDLCESETTDPVGPYPNMTRADWIMPKAGSTRRYIKHDIKDVDGTEYCLFLLSIGNEPCRGHPPSSSSHMVNGRQAMLFVLVGQLAFTLLSWAL